MCVVSETNTVRTYNSGYAVVASQQEKAVRNLKQLLSRYILGILIKAARQYNNNNYSVDEQSLYRSRTVMGSSLNRCAVCRVLGSSFQIALDGALHLLDARSVHRIHLLTAFP